MLLDFIKCRGGRIWIDPLEVESVDEQKVNVAGEDGKPEVRLVAVILHGSDQKAMVMDDDRTAAERINEARERFMASGEDEEEELYGEGA